MYCNLDILTVFWTITSIAVACTYIFLSMEENIPGVNILIKFIKNLFLFGKLKRDSKKLEKSQPDFKIEDTVLSSIPKSWFTHFYVVGTVVHTAALTCFLIQLMEGSLPAPVTKIILWINGEHSVNDQSNDVEFNALPVLIVFMLEMLQITRRMFECLCISSFSKGTISFIHYFYGLFLYSSFGIGLLASVKGQAATISLPKNSAELIGCTVGVSMFLWAYYHQHKCMMTFASLRNDDQKDNKSLGHFLPRGHLFELVSSPHYFCEILIYTSFCVIFQFQNYYLLSVALFVWTNQIVAALSNHLWYQKKFHSYPSNRKAVIPYIL